MFVQQNRETMKRIILFAAIFTAAFSAGAQTEKTEAKKQVTKDIKIEENNGVKTMTITTVSDGKTTQEIYSGADVDLKLAEMEKSMKLSPATTSENTTENVEVIVEDGVKTVKIKKNVNGKETEEIYTGAEADKKLKEIEMDPSTETQEKVRTTIHKETHNE